MTAGVVLLAGMAVGGVPASHGSGKVSGVERSQMTREGRSGVNREGRNEVARDGRSGASPEAEVLEVIRAFNDAFEANDPDRYFGYVAEDIVVLTPSNPYRVEGIEDDREEFEWGLRTGRSRIGYFQELQPEVRIYGDAAVVTYYSRGSYGPDESVAYLKETDVLARRSGEWKIVHIHVSATTR